MSDQHKKFLEQIDQQIADVSKDAIPVIDNAKKTLAEESAKLTEQLNETPLDFVVDLAGISPDTLNRNLAQINRRTQMMQHTQARLAPHVNALRTAVGALRHLVNAKSKKISLEESKQQSAYLAKAFGELRCVDEAQVLVEAETELANINDYVKLIEGIQSNNKAAANDVKYQHKIIKDLAAGATLGTMDAGQGKKGKKGKKTPVDPLDALGTEVLESAEIPKTTTNDFSKISGEEPRTEAPADLTAALVDENTLDWDAPTESPETPAETPAEAPEETPADPEKAETPTEEAPTGSLEDSVSEDIRWRIFREMGMTGDHLKLGLYPSKLIEAVKMETVGVAKLAKNAGYHKDQTGDEAKYDLFKKFIKEFAETGGLIQRSLKDPAEERTPENLTTRYEPGPLAERYEEHWHETLTRVQEIASVSRVEVTEGEAVADILSDIEVIEQAEMPVVGEPESTASNVEPLIESKKPDPEPKPEPEKKPLSGAHAMLERKGDENVDPMDLILGSPTDPTEVEGDPLTADERDKGYEAPPDPGQDAAEGPPPPTNVTNELELDEEEIYFVYHNGGNVSAGPSTLQKLVNETGEDLPTQLKTSSDQKWKAASDFGIVRQETVAGPPPPDASPPPPVAVEENPGGGEPVSSTADIDDLLDGLV